MMPDSELAQMAESKCPVSNALRGNVDITVRAELRLPACTRRLTLLRQR
jgi:hypothetical protein